MAAYTNAIDFCEDHAIGIFTKGIHGVLNEVQVSSICSFNKSMILIENIFRVTLIFLVLSVVGLSSLGGFL